MDKQTAMQLLSLKGGESEKEIKTQFRRMLHIHHPDVAGNDNPYADDMVRNLIEAYELLSGMMQQGTGVIRKEWNAPVNAMASADRSIYAAFSLFEEESFILEIARGRYVWDPDEEDFEHFTKSIYNLTEKMLKEAGKDATDPAMVYLFQYLMEEYIYPFHAAEKLAERTEEKDIGGCRYYFTGFIQDAEKQELNKGDQARVRLKDTSLFLQFEHRSDLYKLCFDKDCLYPVIISLLKTQKAAAKCEVTVIPYSKAGSRKNRHIKVSLVISVRDKILDQPLCNRDKIDQLLDRFGAKTEK